jgi:hypothetical protein
MAECLVIGLDEQHFSNFCKRNEPTGIDFKTSTPSTAQRWVTYQTMRFRVERTTQCERSERMATMLVARRGARRVRGRRPVT